MRTVTTLFTTLLLASACGSKTPPAAPAALDGLARAREDEPPASSAALRSAASSEGPRAPLGPTPAPTPTPTPAADDLIVWFADDTGAESLWLRGDDVVARRAEAVAVADGKLWALGKRWRVIKVYPCNEEGEGDRAATPQEVPTSTLVAKELGGASEQKLAESLSEEAAFDGDLDASGVWTHLYGSIGGKVFVDSGSSAYGCGAAHPYTSDTSEVRDLATRASAPIEVSKALSDKTIAAIKAARAASDYKECASAVAEVEPDYAMPWSLALSFDGGVARAAWQVFQESGLGEVGRACDLEVPVAAPLDPTLGYGPIDARVTKIIANQPGRGNFGFASVPADKRDALRVLFEKEPPTFQPAPAATTAAPATDASASALVAKGRKLTLAKDLTGAIAAFDAAIAKDDKLAPAWSGRGYARSLAGDAATAKSDFEKALTLETRDTKFQAAVWYNLGLLGERGADLAGAKAAYVKAVELNPSDAAKKALERVSK